MRTNSEIQLRGNLGSNPEVIALQSGTSCSKFPLAVSHWYKKPNGETLESTSWFNVVAYGKVAQSIQQNLAKGCRVLLFGEMLQRTWTDKDGKQQYGYEVAVSSYELIQIPKKNDN